MRMVLKELGAEARSVKVQVDLGGGNRFMSKHLLYGAKVCAAFKEMSGKGVS